MPSRIVAPDGAGVRAEGAKVRRSAKCMCSCAARCAQRVRSQAGRCWRRSAYAAVTSVATAPRRSLPTNVSGAARPPPRPLRVPRRHRTRAGAAGCRGAAASASDGEAEARCAVRGDVPGAGGGQVGGAWPSGALRFRWEESVTPEASWPRKSSMPSPFGARLGRHRWVSTMITVSFSAFQLRDSVADATAAGRSRRAALLRLWSASLPRPWNTPGPVPPPSCIRTRLHRALQLPHDYAK